MHIEDIDSICGNRNDWLIV